MIIDTHLHIVDRQALGYPWLADAGALNRDSLYETYEREAKRLGIGAVLHMEVDVAESDIEKESDYVGSIAARNGSLIAGAIAACRPERADFPAYLEKMQQNSLVKGFRRVLHVMPDELSEQPMFRENLKRLTGTGLTFDLVVFPRQLKKAMALADLAPDVQFILDHCGVPDIKGQAYEGWKSDMVEIAKRPNVTGKLSGIVAYTDTDNWALDDIRPYAEHTIESFGFNRMVWGSDWPVCTLAGTLSTWVAATHALLEGASRDEKSALLSETARRIWKLPAC